MVEQSLLLLVPNLSFYARFYLLSPFEDIVSEIILCPLIIKIPLPIYRVVPSPCKHAVISHILN